MERAEPVVTAAEEQVRNYYDMLKRLQITDSDLELGATSGTVTSFLELLLQLLFAALATILVLPCECSSLCVLHGELYSFFTSVYHSFSGLSFACILVAPRVLRRIQGSNTDFRCARGRARHICGVVYHVVSISASGFMVVDNMALRDPVQPWRHISESGRL